MRDALNTKRTRRYAIGTILTGRTVRSAADVASVATMVAAGSLTSIDGATFGLFDSAVADDSCSLASGAATLTSPNNPWVAGDVGKAIDVQGAGAAGATLRSRIKAFTSAGIVTLWDNAGTTVAALVSSAGGLAVWGNDRNLTRNLPLLQNEAGTSESSTATETVVATGTSVGRPIADRFGDTFNVKDYGAVADGTADDTAAIQAAVTAALALSAGGDVYLPPGTYKITAPIEIDRGAADPYLRLRIRGAGQATKIVATTTTTAGAATRLQPARVTGAPGTDTDDYNVAAIFVVFAPNSTNVRYFALEGMRLTTSGAAISNVVGVFAPRIALASFRDLWFDDLSEGIQVRNLFLVDMTDLDFRGCGYPIRHNRTASDYGGTSLSMVRVSSVDCDRGFEFDNLVYSSLNACSVEEWSAGNYGFKAINRSIIALNGFGMENGAGPGIYFEGANATSYAAATIGGRTLITANGCNWSLGLGANTLITQFGIATVDLFSIVKRDAALIFAGGLWNQEFNGATQIQVSLEHDNAASTKVPTVELVETVDFGLDAADFIATGTGSKIGRAFVTRNGIRQAGTNGSYPYTGKPYAKLTKAVNQSNATATAAKLVWDTPTNYLDPMGWINAGKDAWTIQTCGLYRVKVQMRVQAMATTLGVGIRIRHNGSTFANAIHYGNGLPDQVVTCEAIVPVFAPGLDLDVTIERVGAGTVALIGDANLNQALIEQV